MDSPHDVIGTAYEVYVASHLKGERGQYFTNRLVVNMMVKMASPSEKDIILDPACGSGGFILTAMNYIFDTIDSSSRTANEAKCCSSIIWRRYFAEACKNSKSKYAFGKRWTRWY